MPRRPPIRSPPPGAGTLDLAKTDTEDIELITQTAFVLCIGDPRVLTGRIAQTQDVLARDRVVELNDRQGFLRPERLSRHSGGKFISLSFTTLFRPF